MLLFQSLFSRRLHGLLCSFHGRGGLETETSNVLCTRARSKAKKRGGTEGASEGVRQKKNRIERLILSHQYGRTKSRIKTRLRLPSLSQSLHCAGRCLGQVKCLLFLSRCATDVTTKQVLRRRFRRTNLGQEHQQHRTNDVCHRHPFSGCGTVSR